MAAGINDLSSIIEMLFTAVKVHLEQLTEGIGHKCCCVQWTVYKLVCVCVCVSELALVLAFNFCSDKQQSANA